MTENALRLSLFLASDATAEVRVIANRHTTRGGYVRGGCPAGTLRCHVRDQLGGDAAEGVYFTPNPRNPVAFPGPNPGAFASGVKPLTSDNDVPARRWLLLDFDRAKTKADRLLSATDAEKAAVWELAERAAARMAGLGWAAPLVVDSGNGVHHYHRLAGPLPGGKVDDPLADPLALLLRLLARELNTPAATIDTSVFNASRIMKLPGTVARKGEPTPDRPHRACKVLGVPDGWSPTEPDPGADVAAAVERLDPGGTTRAGWRATPPRPAAPPPATRSPSAGHADVLVRAAAYLACPGLPPSLSDGTGGGKALYAAQALVHGFELPPATALGLLLAHFNPRCEPPWSVKDLQHKVDQAAKKPLASKPRGWLLHAGRDDGHPDAELPPDVTTLNPTGPGASGDGGVSPSPAADQPEDRPAPDESPDDPHRLARGVLARYRAGGRRGIVYWRDEFHAYGLGGYVAQPPKAFAADVNAAVRRTLVAERQAVYQAAQEGNKTPELPPLVKTTRTLVSNVTGAMEGMCRLSPLIEAPAWINAAAGPDPREVVSVANGIVHLPAYAAGRPDGLRPHTPDFFAPPGTGYQVRRDAPVPGRWLRFLAQTWPNDPDSIALLQEWSGYLLGSDTSRQKMLMLVGVSGGGKSTIQRVIASLVGDRNVANPNLHDFGPGDGLAALVGKSVAVVADAQSGGLGQNAGVVVANLLKISGENEVSVSRKYLPKLEAKLNCRLVFVANEIIRLPNTAAAFNRRWSVLRFNTEVPADKRDGTLGATLTTPESLSGIFNWACEGWARLQRQGRFTETTEGRAATEELARAGSPVADFVGDRCWVDPALSTPRTDLYAAWRAWCEGPGDRRPGSANQFGRDLRAFLPQVVDRRDGPRGDQVRVYAGIRLLPDAESGPRMDDRLPHERPAGGAAVGTPDGPTLPLPEDLG